MSTRMQLFFGRLGLTIYLDKNMIFVIYNESKLGFLVYEA